MIKPVDGGFMVVSHTGRNLGGPYKSRKAAEARLAQIEKFKHMKKK